jgi:hypothetical protein
MLVGEVYAGLLHLAIRQQPDQRFIVEINDLDAITPWIAKVAAETFDKLESVFTDELFAHFRNLRVVAHHDPEVAVASIGLHSFALEHREELMLAKFEKGVTFPFVESLQPEDILVKCDRLFDVADFDSDMVAAINLHAHFLDCLVAIRFTTR